MTKTWIQYLESGIQGVESRIQDCPGFAYIRRSALKENLTLTVSVISGFSICLTAFHHWISATTLNITIMFYLLLLFALTENLLFL